MEAWDRVFHLSLRIFLCLDQGCYQASLRLETPSFQTKILWLQRTYSLGIIIAIMFLTSVVFLHLQRAFKYMISLNSYNHLG